jgi:hypothetical protein
VSQRHRAVQCAVEEISLHPLTFVPIVLTMVK